MTNYNFDTRELVPYREDWGRDEKENFCGSLWYVKEKDGIILKADRSKLVGPRKYLDDYCIAKGLPAAILAQGDELLRSDFDIRACYQAYFKQARDLFPTKPAYNIPVVLEDWEYSLNQLHRFNHNVCSFIGNYAMMAVGVFLRDISNPYRSDNLVEKINQRYYYTCRLEGKPKPQIIFTQMPRVSERTEAPLVYAFGSNQPMSSAVLQADGFMAAIINLAIFHYWSRRWSEFNFTDLRVVTSVNRAYKQEYPIVEVADLHQLSFDLPADVEDICKAYMVAFEPIMKKVWMRKPEVQLECIEGDNIYTYIYAHEAQSPDRLYASELYANLTNDQKRTLVSYGRRFMEWLVKTYPITTLSQHKVMQAMAKDMPPIQVTIKNNVKVTHAGEEEKPKKKQAKPKFKYIISDDKKEIAQIHKRIELHLSSPAALRDELVRLDDDGLVSLPMDKPTDIIRDIRRIWSEDAPKERSFVTTWGRRI